MDFKEQVIKQVKKEKEFSAAGRYNEALTARIEKRILIAVAKRIPLWIKSDHLTVFSFLGSILICFSYYLTNNSLWWLHVASLGFFISWFGDSLDGTVARVRGVGRERYGFYLDHLLDMISALLMSMGLALSPLTTTIPAVFFLLSYYFLAMYSYLLTYTARVLKISFGKLGPTEIRMIAMIFNTLTFFYPHVRIKILNWSFTFFDLILLVAGAFMAVSFVTSSMRTMIILDEVDPLVDD